jgi:hypothetical protein
MTALSIAVYDETNYEAEKSSRKSLTPREFVGQLFVKYFNHGWSYIYALMPKEGEKAKWYTKKGYPLELRNLWSLYKNEEKLLGLRFGTDTNYCLFDLDQWGDYHPDVSEENFKKVLAILEEIGLCRPVVIRSSESGGLHVYYFLPYQVHSFTLAATIERVLADKGDFLQKGHLEVFPNPKPFNKTRITNFNGHRLPLQKGSGSYLVDYDYEPVSDDIEELLEQAEFTSALQDMESLSEAMRVTDRWYKRQFRYERKRGEKKMSGAEFRFDLEEVIEEGWTGRGQTNDLLLKMAAFGVVFLGLSGDRLVDYIVKTAKNSPGYGKYCGHRHEIDKRARDVAKSAENFPYTPYCSYPRRDISYTECFYGRGRDKNRGSGDSNIVRFAKSRERHEQTVERVAEIVRILKAEGAFPEGICQREKAIRAKSIEMYNVGGSSSTLRKPEYLPLWHPLYEHLLYKDESNEEGVGEELVDENMLAEEETGAVVENENIDCLGEEKELIGEDKELVVDDSSNGEVVSSEIITDSDESGESEKIVNGEIVSANIDCGEVIEKITEEGFEQKEGGEEEGVNGDYRVEKNGTLENLDLEGEEPEAVRSRDCRELQVHLKNETLKVRQGEGLEELQVLNIYEGGLAPVELGEAKRSEELVQEGNLLNPSEGRVWQILVYSIALQIFESITKTGINSINSNSSNFIIEANESELTNSELINCLQPLIDKCFLYSATAEKSPKDDKFSLLMIKILEFMTGKLTLQPTPASVRYFEPSVKPCNASCPENKGFGVKDIEPVLYGSNKRQYQQEETEDKQNYDCEGRQDGGDNSNLRREEASSQVPSQVPIANQQVQVAPTRSQDIHVTSEEILPQQWQEMHFKLKAPREAKRLLNIFCNEQGEDITASVSRKREILEQFLRYCLMWRSPFEALRLEAREWFESRRELIAQLEIESFSAFWDYFGELVF